ncbi:hypothetical protein [Thermosyntropha sp.]|nr:hypothetical protein [Thermosyntropha sp.]MBO8158509.1 hypothetical protein [Thermosyntropha sp.]
MKVWMGEEGMVCYAIISFCLLTRIFGFFLYLLKPDKFFKEGKDIIWQ